MTWNLLYKMDPQWIPVGSATGIRLQTNVVYNPNPIDLILGQEFLVKQTTTIGFNPKRQIQRALTLSLPDNQVVEVKYHNRTKSPNGFGSVECPLNSEIRRQDNVNLFR